MNRRLLASIGIIGEIIAYVEGGFHFESRNGMTSISLPPLVLLSWVLFLFAAASTEFGEIQQGIAKASWWRKSISFLYDSSILFTLLFIPVTFIGLLVAVGGFPPPWSITGGTLVHNEFFGILSTISILLFWALMGLALHPRVRTPGMILTNIDIRIEPPTSLARIAFFGVFAYYGVFVPLFNLFALGVKARGTIRGI